MMRSNSDLPQCGLVMTYKTDRASKVQWEPEQPSGIVMRHSELPSDQVQSSWPPGTILLSQAGESASSPRLHPVPTTDPDDPLNWSSRRKTIHFTLVNFYVFLSFVQLDIGGAAWKAYQQELHFTPNFLNASVAYNYVGLACGCILFVPLIYKYGRRPVYLCSAVLQLAACVLTALTRNEGDFVAGNLLTGFGGAVSEIIAQVTIADVYFVHQHAAMNGWFLFAQTAGATLGPVASGYVVDGQGWRWMWWWCVVLFGVNLVLVVFLFEESKYLVPTRYQTTAAPCEETSKLPLSDLAQDAHVHHLEYNEDSYAPRRKTYRQRLAFTTKTKGSIWRDFYRPLIPLFKFAAIAYAAVTFGTLSISFAVISSVMSIYLFEPPYNFSAASVGLINLALFVTAIPSLLFGGYGNDLVILWLAKRNRGVFEPEMRLWLALPMAIICPGGVLLSGLTISYGGPWPLIAVGLGLFGFGMNVINDAALSYAMDSYHEIIGSAMVGVVFVRNAASIGILFGLTPWIEKSGVRNVNIVIFCFCFAVLLLPIVLLIWGKRARAASAASYKKLAERQLAARRA
ncbi:Major facilitator superfamily transporter [Cordyceps militaris CM01]|uniref:Major facilitator superfamily transporter n=1 Tax=Cordyceps militaris (strain CM01) TaxID=983644 RepID=G3J2W7_CORMM|nr:Major facilitator superfamily transporter [Cordyceps militaris CM01]EGX97246.1 Major facilitator superfamily transporter [Cordyceps militaris CM01]